MRTRLILLGLFLFLFTSIISAQQNIINKILEAEATEHTQSSLITDSTASSNRFIRFEKSAEINWLVDIEESGWYDLTFRYRSPEGEKVETLTRKGYARPIGFGYAEEWNNFSTNTFLQPGENEISLSENWGSIDIDYLKISPANVSPTIKPVSNYFYKSEPCDISIKINKYGSLIDSVKLSDRALNYSLEEYPFQEDAVFLVVRGTQLLNYAVGCAVINIYFNSGDVGIFELNILDKPKQYDMEIVVPDIEHGTSVIIKLPNKETMLVDCGKAWARDSILIPTLRKENVDQIDYFILTHYHEDHDGGDKGETIKNLFNVKNFYDYQSFSTGEEFSIGEAHFKILNSYEDGSEENTRSLSFKMEYRGFVYLHGGDTYGENQEKIMQHFPEDIEADVFHANHHFHGSVNVDYLRAVNPYIVLIQAEQAIYARSAYTEDFKKKTEDYFREHESRYIEDLPNIEVGNVIIRIDGKDNWIYETRK